MRIKAKLDGPNFNVTYIEGEKLEGCELPCPNGMHTHHYVLVEDETGELYEYWKNQHTGIKGYLATHHTYSNQWYRFYGNS